MFALMIHATPSLSLARQSRLHYLHHEQENRWVTFLLAAAYIGLLLTWLAVAIR